MEADLFGVKVPLPDGTSTTIQAERRDGNTFRLTILNTTVHIGNVTKIRRCLWIGANGERFYTRRAAVIWTTLFHLLGVEWNSV